MTYYQKNKEQRQIYDKIYRENNKELIAEKKKIYMEKYREENKEKNNTQIKCECGVFVVPRNMGRHLETKKHFSLMKKA